MNTIKNLVTNKDISIIFWALILLLTILIYKKTRYKVVSILKTSLHWKILIPQILLMSYLWLIIIFIKDNLFWTTSLLRNSIIFVLITSTSLLFRVTTAKNHNQSLKSIILDIIKLNIFIEFIINYTSNNLILEILIIPIVFLVATIIIITENDEKRVKINYFFKIVELIITLYLVITSVLRFIISFRTVDYFQLGKEFIFTPILTLTIIPIIYIFVFFMYIENLSTFLKRNINFSKANEIRAVLSYIKLSKFKLDNFIKYIHYRGYHPLYISNLNQISEFKVFIMNQVNKYKKNILKVLTYRDYIVLGVLYGITIGSIICIIIYNKCSFFLLDSMLLSTFSICIMIFVISLYHTIKNSINIFQMIILILTLILTIKYTVILECKYFNIEVTNTIATIFLPLLFTILLSTILLVFVIKKYRKYKKDKYYANSIEIKFSTNFLSDINNSLINSIQEAKEKLNEDLLDLRSVYFIEDITLSENNVIICLNGTPKQKIELNTEEIYYKLADEIVSFVKKYRFFFEINTI